MVVFNSNSLEGLPKIRYAKRITIHPLAQFFFKNMIYSFHSCFWYIGVAVGDHYNDGFDPSLHRSLHTQQYSAGKMMLVPVQAA